MTETRVDGSGTAARMPAVGHYKALNASMGPSWRFSAARVRVARSNQARGKKEVVGCSAGEPDPVSGAIWLPLRNRQREILAYTLIDECDRDLAELTWSRNGGGYAQHFEPLREGSGRGRRVLLHRAILAAPDGLEVDHINRNRLDNRRCNLRLATRSENARNTKLAENNTCGYKGVRFIDAVSRWGAVVIFDRESYWLGLYETPEQAAFAYDLGAVALHGEFASPNFLISAATRAAAAEFRASLVASREHERKLLCHQSVSERTPGIAA